MAEKVLGFKITVDGNEKLLKTIDELKKSIKATRKELEQEPIGTKRFKQLNEQLGEAKNELTQITKAQKEAQREFERTKSAEGSYRQLNAQLVVSRNRFKELGKEAREGIAGQKLLKQIQELDLELKDLDKTIGQSQRNVGNYASAFEGVESAFTGGATGLAAFAFGAAGLGAAGGVIIDQTQAIIELTNELFNLQGAVQQLTGATGSDLDEFTARIAAISETFGVSTDEVLQSANALTQQLTGDFSESLNVISQGFIAGADATGELLDSTKEYATFIAEAGLNAQDFLNIINTSVKQGLFSDKGIDTVKEAVLSLRELPQPAIDALNAIGLTGEQITDTIGEKGVGAAIALVSDRLGDFEDDSREVGQVLADIFKGAGEDAGVGFVKSLATLGQEFEQLEGAATQYAERQARILALNTELARAQVALTNEISNGTDAYTETSTAIQTKLTVGLTQLIANLKGVTTLVAEGVEAFNKMAERSKALGGVINTLKVFFGALFFPITQVIALFTVDFPAAFAGFQAAAQAVIENASNLFTRFTATARIAGLEIQKAFRRGDAKQAIQDQIDAIDAQRTEAKAAGEGIGEAFNRGFEDAVKSRKAQQAIADAQKKAAAQAEEQRAKITATAIKKTTETKKKADKEQARNTLEVVDLTSKSILDKEIELSDKLLQQRKQGAQDSLNLAKQTADEQIEIEKEKAAQIAEDERQQKIDAAFEVATLVADTAFQIAEERSNQRFEAEQADLDERMAAELEAVKGNASAEEAIKKKFAAESEKLEAEQSKRNKARAIAQATINGALAITNILATSIDPTGVTTAIRVGLAAATTAAQIAVIAAQQFAGGGVVLGNGRINRQGNIPTQGNGDNMLATVRTGEVILNRRQQAALGGANTFSAIGVPGFQGGGLTGNVPAIQGVTVAAGQGDVINVLRQDIAATKLLALEVANSVTRLQVNLDTDQLRTAQVNKVILDSEKTL